MNTCPFCDPEVPSPAPNPPAPPRRLRKLWKGTHWLVPSLLLAFMPKYPMCIVAYVALFTGIGISLTAAHWIQLFLWSLCLLSLAYLAITRIPLFQRSR
jgi:hypothetical protein